MAMNLNAAQVLHLHHLHQQLAAAPHGKKAPVLERAAAELGVAPGTVHRWLAEHLKRDSGRSTRTDAGGRSVSREELELISAALYGTFRKTGNRIMTFDAAVDMLRANGVIGTGLTAARLATILTEQGLHPSQMTRPTPAVAQRSLHPNWVWQVDASVCVAFYLSNATGLQVMDEKKFYKNKPGNVTRIQAERLIRYTLADHYTHELLTRYYLGSECSAHLADFLIWAFASKGDAHVMHGVPFIVEMDMGSANTSAPVLNLLERMKVRVIIHERHNSRANGSVEKGHHLVEIHFESALRFARVQGLEDLNEKALAWANVHGATKIHSRYGRTRHDLWLTITADQLRLAPPVELMRELVTTHPVHRRVSNNLTVEFRGKVYDVRYVPGVMAGRRVEVVINPYRLPAVDVAYPDASTGELAWMTVEPNEYGADGFEVDAPVKGLELRQAHRGALEHNREAVLLRAYDGAHIPLDGTHTEKVAAAEKAQETGALVFGGLVDPFKPVADTALPTYLPKRGTALDATPRQVEVPRLNVVEACSRIRAGLDRIGLVACYDPATVFPWVQQRWGDDGMPEDQVDAVCAQLAQNHVRSAQQPEPGTAVPLRAVGGGQ